MATETATNKQASGEPSHSVIGVAPLFAAVAAVGTGVAALNAVGVVGQMERNYEFEFFVAIGLAILGTLLSALVVSGLLGKDTDLVALRTAADQGAAEAWEISRSANASWQKASAETDDDRVLTAAKETLAIADGIAEKLRKVAAAGHDFARYLPRYSRKRARLRGAVHDAYRVARPVSDDVMRAALAGDREEALAAAAKAADEARFRAGRAEVLAGHLHAAFDDTRDWWALLRRVGRIVGALAVAGAVVVACWLAIRAAGESETPVIDVTITPVAQPGEDKAATRTYDVNAAIKVNDLPAEAQLTVLVDGLQVDPPADDGDQAIADTTDQRPRHRPTTLFHGKHGPRIHAPGLQVPAPADDGEQTTADTTDQRPRYAPTTLFHGKYGPDDEGNIDIHARVRLTRGTALPAFHAVGVQAHVLEGDELAEEDDEPPEENPCADYPLRVSAEALTQAENRARVDPGCVVVTLPSGIAKEKQ